MNQNEINECSRLESAFQYKYIGNKACIEDIINKMYELSLLTEEENYFLTNKNIELMDTFHRINVEEYETLWPIYEEIISVIYEKLKNCNLL